jgi:hypothetical protein
MIIISMKHPDMDKLCAYDKELFNVDSDVEPIIPEDVCLDNFSDGIFQKISYWIPEMSLSKPLIIKRAMQKLAAKTIPEILADATTGQKTPFFTMSGLGALYLGYNKLMDEGLQVPRALAQSPTFEKWILSRPKMLPLIIVGAAAATAGAQWFLKNKMQKQAGFVDKITRAYAPGYLKRMLVGVPATYLYAGYQENKLRQGQQISDFGNLVRKHPFLASLGTTYGLYKGPQIVRGALAGVKTAELNPDVILLELTQDKLDELYCDIIGAPIT